MPEAPPDSSTIHRPSSLQRPKHGALSIWGWLGAVFVLLAAGALAVKWTVAKTDRSLRAELLRNAALVAQVIDARRMESLPFETGARELPEFQQQNRQMRELVSFFQENWVPAREYMSIYSMRLRDGKIVFGPESINFSDRTASPPGTVYVDPPPGLAELYSSPQAITVGPYTDEYGTFVSAFLPLAGTKPGAETTVIGVDIMANDWRHTVLAAAAWPSGLTLGALGLLALSLFLMRSNHLVRHQQVVLRESEKALRESEENLNRAQEVAKVGSWVLDLPCNELVWSAETHRIFGVPPGTPMSYELFIGRVHPGDREMVERAWQAALQRKPYAIEHRILVDGVEKWVAERACVEFDAAGRPLRAVGTVQDITERRRAEEQRLLLATAIEQTGEAIVVTDPAGTILYVNPAFEKSSGYTRLEALGQNARALKSGKLEDGFYRQLWETLTRGETWTGRFVNKRKDGSVFEEDATISPLRDAAGQIVSYVAAKRDVTHEVELETQLRQSQKMEAIGRLAGGVAHDFNNILGAMMMQAELAIECEGVPDEARQLLNDIRVAAERAAGLTRQLLAFSRRQVMQPRVLDLNESVTNLSRMLQRILGEDVRMQLNLHPAPLMTRADAAMLDQVLVNFAVNARDAMPGGGRLTIETSEENVGQQDAHAMPELAPGRYVCLRVTDTGCGVAPADMERIFEPFFTTKEDGKGTGLGLATVFGIVKQHRGWIDVESEVGRGTTFRVLLPASDVVDGFVNGKTARPKPRGGTETILLVEDDPGLRMVIRSALELHGYRVIEAGDGVEALRLWEQWPGHVHLLLTDVVMPEGISGRELAARLQASEPGLRVIFASGYGPELAGHDLHLEQGRNFLQKPCNPQQLLETVRRSLDSECMPAVPASC